MSERIISTEGFHCVNNAVVYDLDESLIAAGYPMRTHPSETFLGANEHDIERGKKLSKAANGINHAHDQFLTGIRVNFDLTFSNKAWVEAERYRFLEFVSSQSSMHRITKFDIRLQCNKYVRQPVITLLEDMVVDYNYLVAERDRAVAANNKEEAAKLSSSLVEAYLEILYNIPAGFELTARMTTNYRCLKNIYNQRKDHRLPEWREFTKWIETSLPYSQELITCVEV